MQTNSRGTRWLLALAGLPVVALAPVAAEAAPCDLSAPSRTINATHKGELLILAGESVLVTNTLVEGNILLTPGSHVSIVNSMVKGSVSDLESGSDPVSVCLRGDAAGKAFVDGSVYLAASFLGSKLEAYHGAEIKGSFELSQSAAEPTCGGDMTIQGSGSLRPVFWGSVQATGACAMTVDHAKLNSDLQADSVAGTINFTNNSSNSDVAFTDAGAVNVAGNSDLGGDLQVDEADAVTVMNNGNNGGVIKGLMSFSYNDNVTVVNNQTMKGVDSLGDGEITIADNIFDEGFIKVSGIAGTSQKAVVDGNTVGGGSLAVYDAPDVTVIYNDVLNGNLEVARFTTCVAHDNVVPKGNTLTAGCADENGDTGGTTDPTDPTDPEACEPADPGEPVDENGCELNTSTNDSTNNSTNDSTNNSTNDSTDTSTNDSTDTSTNNGKRGKTSGKN